MSILFIFALYDEMFNSKSISAIHLFLNFDSISENEIETNKDNSKYLKIFNLLMNNIESFNNDRIRFGLKSIRSVVIHHKSTKNKLCYKLINQCKPNNDNIVYTIDGSNSVMFFKSSNLSSFYKKQKIKRKNYAYLHVCYKEIDGSTYLIYKESMYGENLSSLYFDSKYLNRYKSIFFIKDTRVVKDDCMKIKVLEQEITSQKLLNIGEK